MTTTSPDSLRTPNNTDAYNLVADLATLASDTQAALVARANSYKGTGTQRAAFTTAPNGTLWQDTDGNKGLYRKDTSGWFTVAIEEYGTSTERGTITPYFGQRWVDTDGSKYTWKGDASGNWRRSSGRIVVPSASWATTYGDILAGRTISVDIPTTIQADESIIIQQLNGGSGFNFIGQQSVGTSSGGVTPVTFRYMQLMSLATQGVTIWWQLVDLPD